MSIASALKKASSKALKKLGGNVTLRQISTGSYNTSTGAIAETTTDSTVKGFLENIKTTETNDLIRAKDKKLTISAQGISTEVTSQDRIIIAGIEYQIIQVDKNEQNNVIITYELYLRA